MSEIMTLLREEHRNIAKLLSALEHQLAIFDTGEQADYDLLAAIADYFMTFPDRCHHPKEDLVYRKMCEREPPHSRGGHAHHKIPTLEIEGGGGRGELSLSL